MRLLYLLYISFFTLALSQPQNPEKSEKKNDTLQDKLHQAKERAEQGYETITVHVVPHSHDDLGWTRTIDSYWYERVLGIYNQLPETITKDNNRTFTIDGIDFLMMWWRDQNEETQKKMVDLVKSGRIEILNGGWSEHDEGCAYYSDMISNMQFGQLMVLKEFGITPKVGWQIDVFGLSATNARLYADMGIKAVFMNRVDVHEREIRRRGKELEFVWRPYYQFSGKDAQIFGHLFWHHYSVPEFWNIKVHEDIIISTPLETDQQWDEFIDQMNDYLTEQKHCHLSEHQLFTVGDDFFYFKQQAVNLQKVETVFTKLNQKYPNITWKFSTPSNYIDAIQAQKNVYPVKYDEFMPFVDDPELGNYWIGYYTSRPNLKSQIRQLTHLNFGANKLFSMYSLKLENFWDSMNNELIVSRDNLLDAVGMSNHHDAITGTCRQEVADDYAFRIHKALHETRLTMSQLMRVQAEADTGIKFDNFLYCDKNNGTYLDCPQARNLSAKVWVIGVFNPGLKKRYIVKIKLPHPHWYVEVWDQRYKRWESTQSEAICEPYKLESSETVINCETYIKLDNQAFQFSYARVTFDDSLDISIKPEKKDASKKFVQIQNSNITLKYHNNYNGAYLTLHKSNGAYEPFIFDLRYYRSLALPRQDEIRKGQPSSGMYMFVANMSDNGGQSDRFSDVRSIKVYKGKLIQQITFQMRGREANLATARVKLQNFGQFQDLMFWDVNVYGANPREKSNEITVNFLALNLNSKEVFWTDSNGLRMMRRKLNSRDSYQMRSPQMTSSNYYPVGSAIALYDDETNLQMTVMPDRPMGGSSLKQGRIELLVHRRVDGDEQRGVFEHLIEVGPERRPIHVHSEFAVHIFNKRQEKTLQRQYQIFYNQPQQIFFSDKFTYNHTSDYSRVRSKFMPNYFTDKFLKKVGITDNVNIYMMPLDQNVISVRLENLEDKFDSPTISNRTAPQINLREFMWEFYKLSNNDDLVKKYIDTFDLNIIELGLSGNQKVENVKKNRNIWIGSDDDTITPTSYLKDNETNGKYILEHQRLRTFLVEFQSKGVDEIIQE